MAGQHPRAGQPPLLTRSVRKFAHCRLQGRIFKHHSAVVAPVANICLIVVVDDFDSRTSLLGRGRASGRRPFGTVRCHGYSGRGESDSASGASLQYSRSRRSLAHRTTMRPPWVSPPCSWRQLGVGPTVGPSLSGPGTEDANYRKPERATKAARHICDVCR